MYSSGGWNTMPGSCSSGFKSRPSAAAGNSRSNGLDVSSMNSRKPNADEPHHAEHARDHLVGQVAALQRDRDRPRAEHEHPQQHRALVRAPGGRDPVLERQLRIGIGRDVDHREVVGDERVREAAERDRDEQELPRGERARERHPRRDAARAPTSGSVPSSAASSSARISANWPSSGIIGSVLCVIACTVLAALSIAARVCAWSTAAAASGGM